MKKTYEFHELEEKFKKEAANHVWEKEYDHVEWSWVGDELQEGLEEKLKEAGFDFHVGPVQWEYDGYRTRLSSVKAWITTEKQKELLGESLYKDFSNLEEMSNGYAEEQYFDEEPYSIVFDFAYNTGIEDMITWIEHYVQLEPSHYPQYRLHILLENEEKLDEMSEWIESDFKQIGEAICRSIVDVLYDHVSKTEEEMERYLKDVIDYYEGDQYTYDTLDCEGTHLQEKYLFFKDGTPLERDELVVECRECREIVEVEEIEIREEKNRCYAICSECLERENESNIQLQKTLPN